MLAVDDRVVVVKSSTEIKKTHKITVLLVDDQAMIAELVRRMLSSEQDIIFHHCSDPTQAIKTANEISPTVILQDLVMPDVNGMTLVKFYRANPSTREVPVIVLSSKEESEVKAAAFEVGANDYIVKLPDRIELIARIRHHSKGYINMLEKNETYEALLKSQDALAKELSDASKYINSLLPAPIMEGDIKAQWRFITSSQLGGDAFGYYWIDDQNFCVFLLDVCGHGVGSALLSISVINVLRSLALPNTDFKNPSEVFYSLNKVFSREKQNYKFFTIWYGVFNKVTRKLKYSCGGHPPAILLRDVMGKTLCSRLGVGGSGVGMLNKVTYKNDECDIVPGSTLYLFSDGVFEVKRKDGGEYWTEEEFVKFMLSQPRNESVMDNVLSYTRELRGIDSALADDFSLIQLTF